jgi:RNA polymerase sigma factor (TIGR02999 family)
VAERDIEAVTKILLRAEAGDRGARDELFRAVYDELHLIARRARRRWSGGHTLNTTALVHEAYLKLVNADRLEAGSRAHFLAIAARAMRQILMNYAQSRRTQKRGGGGPQLSLDEVGELAAPGPALSSEHADLLLGLEDALR